MTTHDDPSNRQQSSQDADSQERNGSTRRLCVLIGLLALALFALWYDYKVARPAVEKAYEQVSIMNDEINSAAEHRRMTNVDVQSALRRSPSETFLAEGFTIEAYRWSAGMPIAFRGLSGDEAPGIGLKTHDYYAVYRKDGAELAFVTHFKFDLDQEELAVKPSVAGPDAGASDDVAAAGMEAPGGSGPGAGGGPGGGGPGGGPGGGGGFNPEAMFAERDADGDGKLTGEEISDRMRQNLAAIDTDGDGSVSKEELVARMSQFGGRGGRGGLGGDGGERGTAGEGEGRRQRPPLESSSETPSSEPASNDASPTVDTKDAPAETAPEQAAAQTPHAATLTK